ncbi:MAG: hypothetical protein VKP57_03795 [Candidatus Sericytochromatia bacterium]|nr:hypothetical protein [Candidatus Sericytochromatia bacterium]
MWLSRFFRRRKSRKPKGPGLAPGRALSGSLGGLRPAGLIEMAALIGPDQTPVPVIIRRGRPEDAQVFAKWPEPTWFDWVGLAMGRSSGRDVKGHVDFGKASSLMVLELLNPAATGVSIVGGVAVGVDRSGKVPVLEVRYLERMPGSPLKGIGKLLLVAALYEAARLEAALVLDALLKSGSDIFYRRCGMVESGQSQEPALTRRMAFPDPTRASRFLESCRVEGLLP